MCHALCSLILAAAVVILQQQTALAGPCPHPFKANSQSSSSYIEYCVSDNGNITDIKTPFDGRRFGALSPYGVTEGYGLCQESPTVAYYDYGSKVSGNWGAAQIVSVTASSINIKRTTGDGNWTLAQTISKVALTGSIKIVMALTNNQAVERIAYLLRWIGSSTEIEGHTAGASLNSAWMWSNSPNTLHYGLQLLNAGKSPFPYRQGFVNHVVTPPGPNPCDFAYETAETGMDGPLYIAAFSYVYAGAVPAGATRTVTLNYRGM